LVKGKSKRRGNSGRGVAFEQRILRVLRVQYPRHFLPKEVQERRGITHKPAADFVGYQSEGKGYIAVIAEITVENKGLTELKKQFEGARDLVVGEFGHGPIRYEYRIYTNSKRLFAALKKKEFQLLIYDDDREVKVII
jgi:hypothetical protein